MAHREDWQPDFTPERWEYRDMGTAFTGRMVGDFTELTCKDTGQRWHVQPLGGHWTAWEMDGTLAGRLAHLAEDRRSVIQSIEDDASRRVQAIG